MRHKLIAKFKTFTARLLLKPALILRSPDLAAFALAFVSWRAGQGGYRVLCLGRSVFVDDLKAMATYSGKISYLVVHLQHFEQMLSYFVPEPERSELTELNYYRTAAGLAGRKLYREFLEQVLPKLAGRLRFQAILSGNIGYVVQQEIVRAARACRVPFLVLHKEAMDVFGGILHYYSNYRFFGDQILFYTERARAEVGKRVPDLKSEQTAVVGCPRFDAYFQNFPESQARQLVFFAFFPQDKFLPQIRSTEKLAEAKAAYARFHRTVMDFAARRPEWRVTIKTKTAPHYLQYVAGIYRQAYPNGLANLVLTDAARTHSLIREAQAVIGFDSTVLVEAVAAGRPVIRPDFREFVSGSAWDFFAGFEGLVNYVKTVADLDTVLGSLLARKPDRELRQKFLTELIGTDSGGASARAEQAIIDVIEKTS